MIRNLIVSLGIGVIFISFIVLFFIILATRGDDSGGHSKFSAGLFFSGILGIGAVIINMGLSI